MLGCAATRSGRHLPLGDLPRKRSCCFDGQKYGHIQHWSMLHAFAPQIKPLEQAHHRDSSVKHPAGGAYMNLNKDETEAVGKGNVAQSLRRHTYCVIPAQHLRLATHSQGMRKRGSETARCIARKVIRRLLTVFVLAQIPTWWEPRLATQSLRALLPRECCRPLSCTGPTAILKVLYAGWCRMCTGHCRHTLLADYFASACAACSTDFQWPQLALSCCMSETAFRTFTDV